MAVIQAKFLIDDELLDAFAERVALKQLERSGMTSPAPAEDDPWAGETATDGPPQRATTTAAPSAPTCQHGTRRYVPAGFRKADGQPYPAFWGCAAAQGDPTKCKSVPA